MRFNLHRFDKYKKLNLSNFAHVLSVICMAPMLLIYFCLFFISSSVDFIEYFAREYTSLFFGVQLIPLILALILHNIFCNNE